MLVREVPIPQRTDIRAWFRWLAVALAWLAVVLMCVAVALPSIMDSGPRCRRSEEEAQLATLSHRARTYFIEKQSFPIGRSQTMPPWSCCPAACGVVPKQAWAADPIWAALDFSVDHPTQVQYSYESVDGQTFRVTAVRDPKCNGVLSTLVIKGSIDKTGGPRVDWVGP